MLVFVEVLGYNYCDQRVRDVPAPKTRHSARLPPRPVLADICARFSPVSFRAGAVLAQLWRARAFNVYWTEFYRRFRRQYLCHAA